MAKKEDLSEQMKARENRRKSSVVSTRMRHLKERI